MKMNRHFMLEATTPEGARRFIGDYVDAKSLGEKKSTMVTIARTGKFFDPRYGEFEITRNMLLAMVKNFEANAYGQKIFLDVSHDHSAGSAGEFVRLLVDGNKLRGEVQFTEYGIDAVKKRGMIYLSAEFSENYIDNELRNEHGPTLLGAALTARPVIKHLDPVQLSESALDGVPPTYIDTRITNYLTEERKLTMDKLLKELRAKLLALTLSEPMIVQLLATFKSVATHLAEEEMQRTLLSEFVTQGEVISKQLAAAGGAATTVNFDASGIERILSEQKNSAVSMDAVKKMLAEQQAEQMKTLAEQKTKLDANLKLFNEKIDASEGLKALNEDQMKVVKSGADFITSEMSAEQVTKLAEHQIAAGNQMAVAVQLAGMGYGGSPAGHVHISGGSKNEILSLQEAINTSLKGTSLFSQKKLILAEQGKEHPFVAQVLAVFDTMQAPRLFAESKQLASGVVGTSDTNLPAGFQRTVIREALSDLRVLELINTMTDPSATTTTNIPYETRDVSQVLNDGVVYEGGAIPRAGIGQAMDIAYILPMKVGMLLSNEVMHFSRTSAIDWNAYSRNIESNARYMRELIVRRICNELQRSADAYGAADITGEAFDAQLTGANSIIKTVQYPIVRPHQQRDLQGNAVGSAENAIAIVLNGTAISEYNGSNTQSAGTYYTVTNYNLGYVKLVSELGVAVTPADTGVNTIGYSYATNVAKFDLDNGSVTLKTHLDGLLEAVGDQKAMMAQDRFVMPDFMLMSHTLNNTASKAESFEVSSKRNGSDTDSSGDLETIKNLPGFSTNAPGINLGDERAIIGARGAMTYTIAKPFVTGKPFEATDASGNAIGKQQAYGEEYSAIKVPTALRNRLTSVIAYSFTGR